MLRLPSHGVPHEEEDATPSQIVSRVEVDRSFSFQGIPNVKLKFPSEAPIEDVELLPTGLGSGSMSSTGQITLASFHKIRKLGVGLVTFGVILKFDGFTECECGSDVWQRTKLEDSKLEYNSLFWCSCVETVHKMDGFTCHILGMKKWLGPRGYGLVSMDLTLSAVQWTDSPRGIGYLHYDIRKHCEDSLCYDFSNMEDLLSKQSVTKALGVVDIDFVLRSPVVYQAMLMDRMRNLEAGIPYLYLKMGLSCSYMRDSMTLSATGLSGQKAFGAVPFKVDGSEDGLLKPMIHSVSSRKTEVSPEMKNGKKVFMLHPQRDALVTYSATSGSGTKRELMGPDDSTYAKQMKNALEWLRNERVEYQRLVAILILKFEYLKRQLAIVIRRHRNTEVGEGSRLSFNDFIGSGLEPLEACKALEVTYFILCVCKLIQGGVFVTIQNITVVSELDPDSVFVMIAYWLGLCLVSSILFVKRCCF
ncbi:serine carboxypeptidase-like protein [Tanacetum coccineum]